MPGPLKEDKQQTILSIFIHDFHYLIFKRSHKRNIGKQEQIRSKKGMPCIFARGTMANIPYISDIDQYHSLLINYGPWGQWLPNMLDMPDKSDRIYQMSGRGLLLNSIKCLAGNPKCPAELKSFWQSLITGQYQFYLCTREISLWVIINQLQPMIIVILGRYRFYLCTPEISSWDVIDRLWPRIIIILGSNLNRLRPRIQI